MSRGTARATRLGLVTVLVTLLVWAVAGPAEAHTELEESTPADGATLAKLPASAELVFSEPVTPTALVVTAGGSKLPIQQVPDQPAAVTVDLRSVKPAATVVLAWRMVGSDGHEAEGSLELHVRGAGHGEDRSNREDRGHDGSPRKDEKTDDAAAPPAPPSGQEPALLRPAEVAARVIGYLALAVLIGGLLFVSWLWPAGADETRTRIALIVSVTAGAAAAVAEVAIALWSADGTLTLRTALTEDFGRAYSALILLWSLAAVIVVGLLQGGEPAVRRLAWRVGALAVAFGLIRVTSMNAHASQGSGPVWGEVADFLHLVGVSCWVGGLVVLTVGLLPRRRIEELEEVVPRFSRVAMASVLLIVASGLILVWQLIWPIDEIWATHYNRVLLIKLSFFVMVMIAAMASKRWVDRTVAHSSTARRGTAVRSIATSVAAETVLVAAVLGAASVLATSSPGV